MELDVEVPRIDPVRSTRALAVGEVDTAEIVLFSEPRGAVLLLCEPGGLDTHATGLMNALAEHGYETLATDLSVLALDDEGLRIAVEGLLDVLAERGWEREQTGVVGYADGGRAALVAARDLEVGAAVSMSPTALTDVTEPAVRTPWLGMFGEHDSAAPATAVARLEQQVGRGPAFSRLVVYPGVGADFHRASASSLDHAAAFDSWQRVVEWLNVRVDFRPTPFARTWAARLRADRT